MVFYDPDLTMGNESSISTTKVWYSDQTGRHYSSQVRAEQAERQSEEAIQRIYSTLKIYWDTGIINIRSLGYYQDLEEHFMTHKSDCEILQSYIATSWGYCIVAVFQSEGYFELARQAISIARETGGYAFSGPEEPDDFVLDDFWL